MGPLPARGDVQAPHVPWQGDDQAWWDWYMTLARNPSGSSAPLTPVTVATSAGAASFAEVVSALSAPYELTAEQRAFFGDEGYVRLPGMIPADVIGTLADRADRLLGAEYGTANPGRFLALEQLWTVDPLLSSVALSSRLGDVAAQLLGADSVRLYHDNILSKEPGCGRTPWHRDRDHYPLATPAICTSWIPLHDVPAEMGPLACLPRSSAPEGTRSISFSSAGTRYDEQIEEALRTAGAEPDSRPFRMGDVSFHAAGCLHSAGPNATTSPRRALSSTYYTDGARVVDKPTVMSGSWTDFLPGVVPGERAVSALNPVVGSSHSGTTPAGLRHPQL